MSLLESEASLLMLPPYATEAEIIELAGDVDAILLRACIVSASVICAAPALKVVSRHGAGVDNVDVAECTRHGIAVAITEEANSQAVSEHVAAERADAAGATLVDLATLLDRADFVSVHVPLNAETRHLFGGAEFAAMKPGSMLVNTARGGIVDELALHEDQVSGHLAAAALDVFETEPMPKIIRCSISTMFCCRPMWPASRRSRWCGCPSERPRTSGGCCAASHRHIW